MYREIEYNGKEYGLDIPRSGAISVVQISRALASGVIADAITQLTGRQAVTSHTVAISDDERDEVILACGWKFSQSKTWRDEWDFLYRRAGGRDSGRGKKIARRLV